MAAIAPDLNALNFQVVSAPGIVHQNMVNQKSQKEYFCLNVFLLNVRKMIVVHSLF